MNLTTSTINRREAWRMAFSAASVALLLAALLLIVPSARAEVHFTSCAADTGNNATAIIPIGSVQAGSSFTPETGDEIAAFRPDGSLCVGSVVYDSTINNSVTVWGNNNITNPVIDGMLSGEVIQWRIWDASEDTEYFATVSYDPTPPFSSTGAYVANGFYRLLSFVPAGTTAVDLVTMGSNAEFSGVMPLLIVVGLVLATVMVLWLNRHRGDKRTERGLR